MSLNVAAVVGELRQRRRNNPDMKVATMTVVAFFDEDAIGAWCCDRIHELAVKHPSRVIVLDGTKTEDRQHVDSTCPEHADCVRTRGDWVELGVKDMRPELLGSAISALALLEAPLVLIWAAAGAAGDPRFDALARLARTIVFNTSILAFDASALRELAAFERADKSATIADLAYLRLYPWQEAISQFFDHESTVRELLHLKRVEVTCGSDPEAYYLLGWLASRLGWKPAGGNELITPLGDRVEFAILRKGLPRRLLKVELASNETRFVAEVDGERAEAIVLSVTGEKTHPGRARPINNIDLAALVERAILTGRTDRVFHEALLAAGALIQRRGD